jgi:TPR repeat protein
MLNRHNYSPKNDPILAAFNAARLGEITPENMTLSTTYAQQGNLSLQRGLILKRDYFEYIEASAAIAFLGGWGNNLPINNGETDLERSVTLFSQAVALGDATRLISLGNALMHLQAESRAITYYRLAHELRQNGAKEALAAFKYSKEFYVHYQRVFIENSAENNKQFNILAEVHPQEFLRMMSSVGDQWSVAKKFLTPKAISKVQARQIGLQVGLEKSAKLPTEIANLIVDFTESSVAIIDKGFNQSIKLAAKPILAEMYAQEIRLSDLQHSILFSRAIKRGKELQAKELDRAKDTWLWSQS